MILLSTVLGSTLQEVFKAVDGSAEKRNVVVSFVLIAIAVCLEVKGSRSIRRLSPRNIRLTQSVYVLRISSS